MLSKVAANQPGGDKVIPTMEQLTQAIDLIKSGNKAQGRQRLAEVIRIEPKNEQAWLWMTLVVDTDEQRRQCLERVLAINPNNERARIGLSKIMSGENTESAAMPSATERITEPESVVETERGLFDAGNFGTPAEPSAEANRAFQVRIAALQREQNIILGAIGGVVGGLIGAVLWAVITNVTEWQIGFMAVGVGFLVGYGVRILGRGIEKIFGIVGGAIALFSVALGNFLVAMGYLAEAWEVSYLGALLNFNYAMTFKLLGAAFHPMDIVFYLIAIYEGYRFSFRQLTHDDQF